jgi:hypothetical protein
VRRSQKKKLNEDVGPVFIIMPFSKSLTRIYSNTIKPTVEKCGLSCVRADEESGPGRIMDDIWKSIRNASFLIADLTDRNPNVFYELGLAHALGKIVILLTQSIQDVPFDLKHIRVIQYRNTPEGRVNLSNSLWESLQEVLLETKQSCVNLSYSVLDSPRIPLSNTMKRERVFKAGIEFARLTEVLKWISFMRGDPDKIMAEACMPVEKALSEISVHLPIPTWISDLPSDEAQSILGLWKKKVYKRLNKLDESLGALINFGFWSFLAISDTWWSQEKSSLYKFRDDLVSLGLQAHISNSIVDKIYKRCSRYLAKEYPNSKDLMAKYFKRMIKQAERDIADTNF